MTVKMLDDSDAGFPLRTKRRHIIGIDDLVTPIEESRSTRLKEVISVEQPY